MLGPVQNREPVLHLAGGNQPSSNLEPVAHGRRSRDYVMFDQQHPAFLLRNRIVPNAARHGQEISLREINRTILELDAQCALHDVERLIAGPARRSGTTAAFWSFITYDPGLIDT